MDYCIKCSQPLFHGTIPHRCIADIPCPSCAALRARIEDVEQLRALMILAWEGRMSFLDAARAVSAWLKEG
jgi:hypothetical protein